MSVVVGSGGGFVGVVAESVVVAGIARLVVAVCVVDLPVVDDMLVMYG